MEDDGRQVRQVGTRSVLTQATKGRSGLGKYRKYREENSFN